MHRRTARIIIVVIWVFAGALMSPWAVYYKQSVSSPAQVPIYTCSQEWPSKDFERIYFLSAIFLTCYTIPLVCIIVCYALIGHRVCNRTAPGIQIDESKVVYRSKVKVVKMLLIVGVVFSFSWLPLYVVNLRGYYGPQVEEDSREFTWLYQVIIPISQWSGSSNSCVNPIIYCFFSSKFRNEFNSLVCCCPGKEGRLENQAFGRSTDTHRHHPMTTIRGNRRMVEVDTGVIPSEQE